MLYPDVQKVVNLSDRIRKAGNELVLTAARIAAAENAAQ